MGSATESNAKPSVMAARDQKTVTKFFKNLFKRDKKKEKKPEVTSDPPEVPEEREKDTIAAKVVENVLQGIEKLNIKDVETKSESEEDELNNFTYQTIKDESRNDSFDSRASGDSGYLDKEEAASDGEDDKQNEEEEEVVLALENLQIEEKEKDDKCAKEKRVRTVVLSRAPVRPKMEYKSAPYYLQQKEHIRQINIHNQLFLTGGQVTENCSDLQKVPARDLQELDSSDFQDVDERHMVNEALEYMQLNRLRARESQEEQLTIIDEYIKNDSVPQDANLAQTSQICPEDLLSDFNFPAAQYQPEPVPNPETPPSQEQPDLPYYPENPITDWSSKDYEILSSLEAFVEIPPQFNGEQFMFPTPPHSVDAASPFSDSQGSFNPNSPMRNLLSSPETSPQSNVDYEKFQEVPHFEMPSPVSLDGEKKGRERNNSTSSMTMKQYKDLQKEISHEFSKKDCCQMTRPSCKQQFQEHLQKLTQEQRGNICLEVSKLDVNDAYGILQAAIKGLARSQLVDANHMVFCLVADMVLAKKPAWYVGDFGLSLLKAAALRCPQRPLLTRYLVQCVRLAIRGDPAAVMGKKSVFHEVDDQGDTLLTACARRGDACADALAELVRAGGGDLPLFRVHHLNADGASALHVACSEHSAAAPRLHTTHVLLEHAAADLWLGDAKAGDTPVHTAVNSKTCDLRLVMVLFKHVERKEWKRLAHAHNLCSSSPLDYARSRGSTRTPTRDGYPTEVLEFLKKCR